MIGLKLCIHFSLVSSINKSFFFFYSINFLSLNKTYHIYIYILCETLNNVTQLNNFDWINIIKTIVRQEKVDWEWIFFEVTSLGERERERIGYIMWNFK